jgi:transposase
MCHEPCYPARSMAYPHPDQSDTQAPVVYQPRDYKDRNLVERMWCRMKDYRRIATRYDKLARNFASSVALVAVIIWWAD